MKKHERLELRGTLMCHSRKAGSDEWVAVWDRPKRNIIPNASLAQIALLWGNAAGVPFTCGVIGTGTATPTITDTALQTSVNVATGSFTRVTTAVANDTAQLVSVHTGPAGGWNITEYAAQVVDGPIACRVTFTAVNVAEGNQLQFTYKCQIQRV